MEALPYEGTSSKAESRSAVQKLRCSSQRAQDHTRYRADIDSSGSALGIRTSVVRVLGRICNLFALRSAAYRGLAVYLDHNLTRTHADKALEKAVKVSATPEKAVPTE